MPKELKEQLNVVVLGQVGPVNPREAPSTSRLVPPGATWNFRIDNGSNKKQQLQEHAWALNKLKLENQRGISGAIFPQRKFETERKVINIVDGVPGTQQVDCAVMMISDISNKFMSEIMDDAKLAKQELGADQMIVAVNIMGSRMPKREFSSIKTTLDPHLRRFYAPEMVSFIPISGLSEGNVMKTSPKMRSWYKGPTLYQALDKVESHKITSHIPIRLVPKGVFFNFGGAGETEGIFKSGFPGECDRKVPEMFRLQFAQKLF